MTVGSAFRTAARTVTESDLVQFVNLCGFNEPLFYDERHAAEGGYTGRLVPGALVYALGEGLVIQSHSFAGTGLAFMHMELDVRRPTVVGDTLDVVVEITEVAPVEQARAWRGDVVATPSTTSGATTCSSTPPCAWCAAATSGHDDAAQQLARRGRSLRRSWRRRPRRGSG